METSLDHLPEAKQRELEHIKTVLMQEFEAALAGGTQPWRRNGKLLKLILFGSFSRNDWVDDPENGYQSDWDLLAIVNHEKLTDVADYWSLAEDKLLRDPKVRRPVNLIVHSLTEVNEALSKGEYFWVDITADGVLLYELPGFPLASPMPLTPVDAYEMAKSYYEKQSRAVSRWLKFAGAAIADIPTDPEWSNNSAFSLHQAAESAYACFLLAQTFYLPKSHNLKFLRSLAEDKDRRLIEAWPRETRLDKRRFELLKRAYIEARYSEHYHIEIEDLRALTAIVGRLKSIVDELCRERIDELRCSAGIQETSRD